MAWKQTAKVTPNISCQPGWCLNYVQRAFNAPWSGPSATEAWKRAKHPHAHIAPPEGVAVPMYFAFNGVPEGHIVVRMGNGSIYSSSSPTSNRPVHHANLAALLAYYGGLLSYRGWSEDLNGYPVVESIKDKAKEEPKMVTELELQIMTRIQVGRTPLESEKKKYIAKWKYDDLWKSMQTWPDTKAARAALKTGKKPIADFLVDEVKSQYTQPASGQYVLVDGPLYRKK